MQSMCSTTWTLYTSYTCTLEETTFYTSFTFFEVGKFLPSFFKKKKHNFIHFILYPFALVVATVHRWELYDLQQLLWNNLPSMGNLILSKWCRESVFYINSLRVFLLVLPCMKLESSDHQVFLWVAHLPQFSSDTQHNLQLNLFQIISRKKWLFPFTCWTYSWPMNEIWIILQINLFSINFV